MTKIRLYIHEGRFFFGLCGAAIIFNLMFFMFALNPVRTEVAGMKEAYAKLKGERDKADAAGRSSRTIRGYIEGVERDLASVMSVMPEQEGMTKVIQDVHSLAKKEGLLIRSASYSSGGDKGGDIVSNVISFPLSGDYRKLRRFIYNLENLDYLISIDDLNISASKGTDVSLSIKISVYFKAGNS